MGTVARMDGLLAGWQESGDRRAVFLECYRLMTLRMLDALARREFHDPAWVEELLHHFAGYYFDAVAAWDLAEPVPPVWREAFGACLDPEVAPVRQLVLGVNAHINYDLIFALADLLREEWPGLDAAARELRRADHRRVNRVIHGTIDVVQDTVLEPRQRMLGTVDIVMGRLDEWGMARLITRWREGVWHHAVELVEAGDSDRCTGLCSRWEAEALVRARRIRGGAPRPSRRRRPEP